jgi:predicted kinase
MYTDQDKFIHWYNEVFRYDPLYAAMWETVEGSPWHREANVGVHTDMVVSQYLMLSNSEGPGMLDSECFNVRGALGCAFHDVGKPPAMQIKFKEDRGEYKAFHGHELISARMWENWAVGNWSFLQREFGFEPIDIYTVGWMIEHHVPWATKKDEKLDAFAATAYTTLGHSCAWTDMLMADQRGRISDSSHQRFEEAQIWIYDHEERRAKAEWGFELVTDKTVYMLIGAPGAGKSTYRQKLLAENPGAAVLSMDDLRIEFYGEPYENAFAKASKDSSFNAKVDARYIDTLRQNEVVILDNTNTAARARKRWLAPARARDFRIVAVLFPVQLQTVLDRQRSRTDKTIPDQVVSDMYNRMSLPMIGDFDEIIVHDGNL